ncbi:MULTISPECIES: glutamyl-tRNA reductase [unclassified Campylobacter]|uniref:glutamyl-tRNA reductase n=1 Tax=unclassified Campylobacter TaxID=2593542 RepID=UPI001474F252|nr:MULTISPECIES: glutamyl-tRNA reductase [unclassified Campylobacter]
MHYTSVSFTHKNTDISVRERLSFSNIERKTEILRLLNSSQNINECMVLNTCNRVEIIASVKEIEGASKHIISCISLLCGIDYEELYTRADIYEDNGAIHHLFAVASSLDSLVIGETQIAGQLKEAFRFAYANGNCGMKLGRAIEAAFKCAAEVRNKTEISKNPVSVSSVAAQKAKEMFDGNINGMVAVIVGAGEMAELAAKHIISSGARVIVIGRNIDKAKALAMSLGDNNEYDSIENLKDYINKYQLIFSATASPYPVILDSMIEKREFDRYFFDIAVPRDIAVTPSENIKIYAVDDLKEIVSRNLALREEQAQIAYTIVGRNTTHFFRHLRELAITPVIKGIREQAKECAQKELEKAIKKGYLKHSDHDEAYKLIHQVFKAFLHAPTMKLKSLADDSNSENIIKFTKNVFDIKNHTHIEDGEFEWESE